MKVTTALLADAATLESSGKLYIHGAGWDSIAVASLPTVHPSMALALVFRFEWNETNEDVPIVIELVDEDNQPMGVRATGVLNVGRPPGVKKGSQLQSPLALTLPPIGIERAGNFRFRVMTHDNELASVPFRVTAPK